MKSRVLLLAICACVCGALPSPRVGFARGTYAAGGSDSSCYALMADAFAAGQLQPASDLAAQVPWPEAGKTFTPGGFVTSETNPSASAPVCAPGFSLLLAPLIAVGGFDAMFLLTPIAGALLVWLTFVAGRAIANPARRRDGSRAHRCQSGDALSGRPADERCDDGCTVDGDVRALLARRWALAGVCCGLALLVRPNLLPLALVAARRNQGLGIGDWGLGMSRGLLSRRFRSRLLVSVAERRAVRQSVSNGLRPARASLQPVGDSAQCVALFRMARRNAHAVSVARLCRAVCRRAREADHDVALAIGLILATCAIYFFYTPFDDWSYLRFLLPAIALMLVLASAVIVHVVTRMPLMRRPALRRHDVGASASAGP